MKKLFIAMLAVAAVTACAKDEAISLNQETIDFGAPFVENATRADYSDGKSLTAFTVYGTVTGNSNTVALFGGNGANVTGSVGATAWNCDETEYWVPNCSYAFQAVADGVINNGAITVSVGNGDIDLLYAEAAATTNAQAAPISGVNSNGVVEFNFTHLMSKVGFSFVNGCTTNTAYGFKITSVSFTGHDTKGTYTISSGAWDSEYTAAGNDAALDFSAGSATHQIIPGAQTLSITVAYDILYTNTDTDTDTTTTTKISATSVTKSLPYTFEKGKSYNIAVTIPAPGGEIKFTTQAVGEWTSNPSGDLELK